MASTTDIGYCEYVIDEGDFFGQVTGAPEPPEYCDDPVLPGSNYCEAHAYHGADLFMLDPYEVVD